MPPLYETLHFYDDDAPDYAAEVSGKIQRKQIFRFSRELKRGARVLDLGSGSSYDALSFIELGFDVTLLDGSTGRRNAIRALRMCAPLRGAGL